MKESLLTQAADRDSQESQSNSPGTRRVILGLLVFLIGPSIVMAWVLSSYFRVDVAASISFWGDDGWCETPEEGIGVHCFGDFSAIRFGSLTENPYVAPQSETPTLIEQYRPEKVYPISSRIIRVPFWIIEKEVGFQSALLVFVAVSLLAVMAPIIWAMWGTSWLDKAAMFSLAGIATVPVLTLADRGQILALAVPLLFGFMLAYLRGRYVLATIALAAAVTIKPQFVLLLLVYAVFRRWNLFFLGAVLCAVFVIFPFAVFGRGSFEALQGWVAASLGWSQAGGSTPSLWPPNLSLSHLIELMGTFVIVPLSNHFTDFVGISIPVELHSPSVVFAVTTLGICSLFLVLFGQKLPGVAVLAGLSMVCVLIVPTSYIYYSAIMMPFAALLLRQESEAEVLAGTSWRSLRVLLIASIVLALTPLVIPISELRANEPVASLTPLLVIFTWTLFVIGLAYRSLKSHLQSESRTASEASEGISTHVE